MEVLYRVCCGLDVHKKTVAACLRVPGPNGTRAEEIRTFGTTTRELLQLADWLAAAGCTHVAMESTGVYWRPVYQILEGNFELLLVNAHHIKAVPGRKTDVKDCQWIASLLEPTGAGGGSARGVRERAREARSSREASHAPTGARSTGNL